MSASANLVCVPPENVRQIWPLVADRLRQAVTRTDLAHTKDIEFDVMEGDGLLWLALDGEKIEAAATTLLVNTDRHLVCIISALGGENMGHWLPLLAEIEAWAKAEGAAKVRIFGRKGWGRVLPGYAVAQVVLERLL